MQTPENNIDYVQCIAHQYGSARQSCTGSSIHRSGSIRTWETGSPDGQYSTSNASYCRNSSTSRSSSSSNACHCGTVPSCGLSGLGSSILRRSTGTHPEADILCRRGRTPRHSPSLQRPAPAASHEAPAADARVQPSPAAEVAARKSAARRAARRVPCPPAQSLGLQQAGSQSTLQPHRRRQLPPLPPPIPRHQCLSRPSSPSSRSRSASRWASRQRRRLRGRRLNLQTKTSNGNRRSVNLNGLLPVVPPQWTSPVTAPRIIRSFDSSSIMQMQQAGRRGQASLTRHCDV